MANEFYRKIFTPSTSKGVLKNVLKNKKRAALILVSCILLFYILLDNKGIIARIRLESQRAEMTEKVKAAEAESKRLQTQIKALEGDKKTIEKVAREKYGMTRKGETIYRVKKD